MTHTLESLAGIARRVEHLLFEAGHPTIVTVAGGAVRDVLTGRADLIRDVDLWLYHPDPAMVAQLVEVSGVLGKLTKRVKYLPRHPTIRAIDYYLADCGEEVNLIFLRQRYDAEELIAGFDFSVNQAAIRLGELFTSEAFKTDTAQGVLRVTRKDSAMRSNRRANKMREKFPAWEYVDDVPEPSPDSSGGGDASGFGY